MLRVRERCYGSKFAPDVFDLRPVRFQATYVTFYTEGFGRFVSSTPLRLLPAGTKAAGWDCLSLGNRAFPRRTTILAHQIFVGHIEGTPRPLAPIGRESRET